MFSSQNFKSKNWEYEKILLYFYPDDVFNEPGQYCPVRKSGFTHHQFEKAKAN